MPKKNKPSTDGLPAGTPPYTSEERVLEQWANGPRSPGPSIAERMAVRSSKAKPAEKKSESNPCD